MRSFAPPLACLWALVGITAATASEPVSTVRIEQAWARATPPGVNVGAAYAVISNRGAADRLVAVESTLSEQVEIHNSSQQAGRMQMRPVAEVDVPAGRRVVFEPGGSHLMLIDLKRPLRQGELLSMTFVFANAGRITVQLPVAPIGSTQAPTSAHDHHH